VDVLVLAGPFMSTVPHWRPALKQGKYGKAVCIEVLAAMWRVACSSKRTAEVEFLSRSFHVTKVRWLCRRTVVELDNCSTLETSFEAVSDLIQFPQRFTRNE
jgi:hypothetical protein